MYKLLIMLALITSVVGCSKNTGITVYKSDLHALIEKDSKKCIIKFRNNDSRHSDIVINNECEKVKFFEDNLSSCINTEYSKTI